MWIILSTFGLCLYDYFICQRCKSIDLYAFRHVVFVVAKTSSLFSIDKFRHPKLSNDELKYGCRLGIDSWADTCCAGRHCYVEEFVQGKVVNATGFTSTLGSLNNLPIAHVLYAYDQPDGTTSVIECNNSIYLGEDMVDSLVNPIQCKDNDVCVDLRPRAYYPSASSAQSIMFEDGTSLQLEYDGVLPYLQVCRPTPDEIHYCKRLQMTSKDDWDPQALGSFSRFNMVTSADSDYITHNMFDSDPISNELMSLHLS